MFKKYKNKKILFLLLVDSIIISTSLGISVCFRYDFSIPLPILHFLNITNIFFLLLLKIVCFKIFGLYKGMLRYTSVWDMINIIKASSFSSFLLISYVYFFLGFESLSRSIFFIDYIICTGGVSVFRLGIRMFFTHFFEFISSKKRIDTRKKVLIIGAGDTGNAILNQTTQMPKLSISVVGFLDDNPNKIGARLNDVPVICNIENINRLNLSYDEIYICIPSANQAQMRNIISLCRKTGKPFKTLPSISELVSGKVAISQLRPVSLVDLLGREEINLNIKPIKKFLKGKRVLVTGAGGSIGSELVRQCMKYEPSLIVLLDISELNLFEIDRETSNRTSKILFKPILSDIRDEKLIDRVFSDFKPEIVFHAAAYKHVPIQESFPQEALKTNVFGTKNLIDASIVQKVEKFVLVSTDKAVRPTNVMGATKRIAELFCQNANYKQSNTEFMAVRFGNVLGSSGSVIPIFQKQIKDGGPLTITDPEMQRYFMSIPEASQLILQAGSIGIGGEIFILDMGDPIKIIDIAKELIRLSGFEPYNDIRIDITGARPGEKIIEELSLESEMLDKTKHEKIFVLNDSRTKVKPDFNYDKILDELRESILKNSPDQIKIALKHVLPDYKPSNKFKTNPIASRNSKLKAKA